MGFVGREAGEMMGGWVQLVRWLRGYRPGLVSVSMTIGCRGHCFSYIHTHRTTFV